MGKMSSPPPSSGFHPLSGMDAGFLYMETPTLHMHTLKVAIMVPPNDASGLTFDVFRRALDHKLALLPSFRQRIMEVRFGLGHPVWVADQDFDSSRHLSHRSASAPGGMDELNAIVSDVASRPLRRDRPLWEITMVDGLAGGRVAFVCKLHHAMADGAAVMAMLLQVLTQPRPGEVVNGSERLRVAGTDFDPLSAQPPPTNWALWRWDLGQALRRLGSLPILLLQTLRGVFNVMKRARDGKQPEVAAVFSGPRTSWSGALTARRSFGTTQMPLTDLKRVKDALGVTLNDVVLAICGGALRVHLKQVEGSVPLEPLLASVPINTHPELSDRMQGNRVGHLTASLCTHIADPIERVRAIHEMSHEAKQRHLALGPDLLEHWIEFAPPKPYVAFSRFWSRHRMADRFNPPVNLIVSNVPGPRDALHIAGHGLEALYSVGPILEGIGLNFTGWSYGGSVYFVGLACPDQIQNIQGLVDLVPQALAELVDACVTTDAATATEVATQRSPDVAVGALVGEPRLQQEGPCGQPAAEEEAQA